MRATYAIGLGGVVAIAGLAASLPWRQAGRVSPYDMYFAPVLEPVPPEPLRTARIIGDSETFGRISDVAPLGPWIVVLDQRADNQVMVIDRARGVVLRTMGRYGRGPGEFVSANALAPADDSAAVWVYDFQGARATLLDLAARSAVRPRTVAMPPGLFQPTWLGDTIVSNGLYAREILRFFTVKNGEARVARGVGVSPFPDVTPDIAVHLNRNALTFDPAHRRLAVAFLYVSRLHFYDRTGQQTRAVAGPTEVTPKYRVVPDPREKIARFLREAETRFAYLDVVATDRHVYALFSGRSRGEFEEQAAFGNTLHVFDWDGQFAGAWTLDQDVRGLAIDPRTATLYGIRDAPFPAVIEFRPLTPPGRGP